MRVITSYSIHYTKLYEALVALERFIDDALLGNLRQVEIIHGAGEGILRRAVREFLSYNFV